MRARLVLFMACSAHMQFEPFGSYVCCLSEPPRFSLSIYENGKNSGWRSVLRFEMRKIPFWREKQLQFLGAFSTSKCDVLSSN